MPFRKNMNAFEFVVLSSLRTAQLVRGCTPRVAVSSNKVTVTARREVEAGQIIRSDKTEP